MSAPDGEEIVQDGLISCDIEQDGMDFIQANIFPLYRKF